MVMIIDNNRQFNDTIGWFSLKLCKDVNSTLWRNLIEPISIKPVTLQEMASLVVTISKSFVSIIPVIKIVTSKGTLSHFTEGVAVKKCAYFCATCIL